jgi:hypothetical protein
VGGLILVDMETAAEVVEDSEGEPWWPEVSKEAFACGVRGATGLPGWRAPTGFA